MTGMEGQFVTFDVARFLKELGFNETCIAYYVINGERFIYDIRGVVNTGLPIKGGSVLGNGSCSAPLWQQVLMFLNNKYNLFVRVFPIEVSITDKGVYRFTWDTLNLTNGDSFCGTSPISFLTIEEATKNAVLKTLQYILVSDLTK